MKLKRTGHLDYISVHTMKKLKMTNLWNRGLDFSRCAVMSMKVRKTEITCFLKSSSKQMLHARLEVLICWSSTSVEFISAKDLNRILYPSTRKEAYWRYLTLFSIFMSCTNLIADQKPIRRSGKRCKPSLPSIFSLIHWKLVKSMLREL